MPPSPPEARFEVRGISPWPFDFRRRVSGPWSERDAPDVYGNTPRWFRALEGLLK